MMGDGDSDEPQKAELPRIRALSWEVRRFAPGAPHNCLRTSANAPLAGCSNRRHRAGARRQSVVSAFLCYPRIGRGRTLSDF
jgi:hypothetical protein